MFKSLMCVAIAASAFSAGSAGSTTLPAAAERDVQCLTLALVATSAEKDQTKQRGIIAEAWYFVGRLEVEAPTLDLKPALNDAFEAMKGKPETKDIGSACDVQFERRGANLRSLGG